jgi:hypothetical protein
MRCKKLIANAQNGQPAYDKTKMQSLPYGLRWALFYEKFDTGVVS